jgi:hypothetical protein
MKNIHVLPTDKPSRLQKFINYVVDKIEFELCSKDEFFNKGQHIYITNDEEIKEGDWYLVELFKITGESDGFHIEKCTKLDDVWCNNFDVISTRHKDNCKKIILTTDQDLIKDGVQDIDDEFLEWFVKNPSCEMVEVEKDEFYSKKAFIEGKDAITFKYEIILPKEEPRQEIDMSKYESGIDPIVEETLEEAAEKYAEGKSSNFTFRTTHIRDFSAGAKWQAKQMYSEEEVRNIVEQTIEKFYKHIYVETKSEMKELWFEQFKKK